MKRRHADCTCKSNWTNNRILMVCEGADMPSSPAAVKIFMDKKLLVN